MPLSVPMIDSMAGSATLELQRPGTDRVVFALRELAAGRVLGRGRRLTHRILTTGGSGSVVARISRGSQSLIWVARLAGPEHLHRFDRIASWLQTQGVGAPRALVHDQGQQLLLVEDSGDRAAADAPAGARGTPDGRLWSGALPDSFPRGALLLGRAAAEASLEVAMEPIADPLARIAAQPMPQARVAIRHCAEWNGGLRPR